MRQSSVPSTAEIPIVSPPPSCFDSLATTTSAVAPSTSRYVFVGEHADHRMSPVWRSTAPNDGSASEGEHGAALPDAAPGAPTLFDGALVGLAGASMPVVGAESVAALVLALVVAGWSAAAGGALAVVL